MFTVNDLEAAKAFYTAQMGFGIAFENEWYLHLLSDTEIRIGFMLPSQPNQPEIFHPVYDGRRVIFSLEVKDVDAAYAAARSHALNIVLPLRFEEWGGATSASRTPTASTWILFKPSCPQRNIRSVVTPDRPFRPPNFQAFNAQ
jgi:catechol 2,3-dioxygenase-like lactoylglutathione lyase family enzyme